MSRVAVVTGGASGMGAAICGRLARQGCRVAVLDVDGDAADQTAKDLQSADATRSRRRSTSATAVRSMRRWPG